MSKLGSPLQGGIVSSTFGPVIDGDLLPENVFEHIAGGRHNRVPILIGSNRDEMSAAVPPGTIRPAMVSALT